ncbi:MAG: ImmA/IrrE family metallo-endopeptidase [Nitrospira sp.]
MATFDRGFKSWAERTSANIRNELGLAPQDGLDVFKLAEFLDVTVLTPNDIPGLPVEVLDQLGRKDPFGWHAVSMSLPDGQMLLIYNPKKSAGRKASDIAHELAHIVLEHKPSTVILSQDGSFAMRTYDQKQEDEANWLAWSLLLPREALIRAMRRGLSIEDTAGLYGVSPQLVNYRLGVTGVSVQLARMRKR